MIGQLGRVFFKGQVAKDNIESRIDGICLKEGTER